MTDQTHRAAATERGPEPDALQRFATDLKERKNFYVGVLAAALAVVVLVLILVNRGESEGPDMFSPVWAAGYWRTTRRWRTCRAE